MAGEPYLYEDGDLVDPPFLQRILLSTGMILRDLNQVQFALGDPDDPSPGNMPEHIAASQLEFGPSSQQIDKGLREMLARLETFHASNQRQQPPRSVKTRPAPQSAGEVHNVTANAEVRETPSPGWNEGPAPSDAPSLASADAVRLQDEIKPLSRLRVEPVGRAVTTVDDVREDAAVGSAVPAPADSVAPADISSPGNPAGQPSSRKELAGNNIALVKTPTSDRRSSWPAATAGQIPPRRHVSDGVTSAAKEARPVPTAQASEGRGAIGSGPSGTSRNVGSRESTPGRAASHGPRPFMLKGVKKKTASAVEEGKAKQGDPIRPIAQDSASPAESDVQGAHPLPSMDPSGALATIMEEAEDDAEAQQGREREGAGVDGREQTVQQMTARTNTVGESRVHRQKRDEPEAHAAGARGRRGNSQSTTKSPADGSTAQTHGPGEGQTVGDKEDAGPGGRGRNRDPATTSRKASPVSSQPEAGPSSRKTSKRGREASERRGGGVATEGSPPPAKRHRARWAQESDVEQEVESGTEPAEQPAAEQGLAEVEPPDRAWNLSSHKVPRRPTLSAKAQENQKGVKKAGPSEAPSELPIPANADGQGGRKKRENSEPAARSQAPSQRGRSRGAARSRGGAKRNAAKGRG